jgi:hypothetical protein
MHVMTSMQVGQTIHQGILAAKAPGVTAGLIGPERYRIKRLKCLLIECLKCLKCLKCSSDGSCRLNTGKKESEWLCSLAKRFFLYEHNISRPFPSYFGEMANISGSCRAWTCGIHPVLFAIASILCIGANAQRILKREDIGIRPPEGSWTMTSASEKKLVGMATPVSAMFFSAKLGSDLFFHRWKKQHITSSGFSIFARFC